MAASVISCPGSGSITPDYGGTASLEAFGQSGGGTCSVPDQQALRTRWDGLVNDDRNSA